MKCPHCKKKVVKYPIKDEQGNIIVKNLFKMDLISFLFLLSILLMIFTFKTDMNNYHNILEHPCTWCVDNGCYDMITQSKTVTPTAELNFSKTADNFESISKIG